MARRLDLSYRPVVAVQGSPRRFGRWIAAFEVVAEVLETTTTAPSVACNMGVPC
jgi:hypothetical protein